MVRERRVTENSWGLIYMRGGLFMFVFVIMGLAILAWMCIPFYWDRQEKKEKGYVFKTHGELIGLMSYTSRGVSTLTIYKDKLMLDDIAIIPIEKVTDVSTHKWVNTIRTGGGFGINRHFGELKVYFKNKEGDQSYFRLSTPKKNMHLLIGDYETAKSKIETYAHIQRPNKPVVPTKPFEL
jgi:hypothetical protein